MILIESKTRLCYNSAQKYFIRKPVRLWKIHLELFDIIFIMYAIGILFTIGVARPNVFKYQKLYQLAWDKAVVLV